MLPVVLDRATAGMGTAEAAFWQVLEAADAAAEAVAFVAGLSAKLAQQGGNAAALPEARKLQLALSQECRPVALASANALAVVANTRGRIVAALAAANTAISERDAALEGSIREEKGLREQAAAMHEQRLALMEELSASDAARAALVDELAELRASHATAQAEHVKQLAELQQSLGPCQTPDRLVERVQRARAANSVRGLSIRTSGTAPARTAPLSPSDCAIEPVFSGVDTLSGSSSGDDVTSVTSSIDVGRGGVIPRELRNGLTHGRRWADGVLASNALGPAHFALSARGNAGGAPHPNQPAPELPLGAVAEVRGGLQARDHALRAMGKRLLALCDQLEREETARQAAEAQGQALRGELERARHEAVDALSQVQKLGRQLADARAVADAVSGVERPESGGAWAHGGPSVRDSSASANTPPWRSMMRESTVRRRLGELQKALNARARDVHAAASRAAFKVAAHAAAHAGSYWSGVSASAALTEVATSCAAAVAAAALLEGVVRIEVEAMSTLLEREEAEHGQARTALLQALQDKAVAERVQASLMQSFDISKMFSAAAALATPGHAPPVATPPPKPPPPLPPPRTPVKASSAPVLDDLVDQLKGFDRSTMRKVAGMPSASPRGLAPPKDFVEELRRGLPRLRPVVGPLTGWRAAGERAGGEVSPPALPLCDGPPGDSGDGAATALGHGAAAGPLTLPTAAGRGGADAMVASAGALVDGAEGAQGGEAAADAATTKTDDSGVASCAAASRQSNEYDGDYF